MIWGCCSCCVSCPCCGEKVQELGLPSGAGIKTTRVPHIQGASAELGSRDRVMDQDSAGAMGGWAEVGVWQLPPLSAPLGP